MKTKGNLQKETTRYEEIYSAQMACASTVFRDEYEATGGPQQVHTANKRQTCIL
jgi:hypothetical protein